MNSTTQIPWRRIAAESAAIVGSILLAFAIDAWWEDRVESRRNLAQLDTVRAELLEVQVQLNHLEDRFIGLRTAVAQLLGHIGPDAPPQSFDSLASKIDLSFRAAKIELPTGSVQALIASGDLSSVSSPDLKALLAAWPADVARLRNQSELIEAGREEIIRYLHDRVPTYRIAYKTGQLDLYPPPGFSGEASLIQGDMKVEGLFGNRGIMIEDTLLIVRDLKVRAALGIELISTLQGE